MTVVALAPQLHAVESGSAPVRRALLIGVNQYATDEFTNLRGAVHDVELLSGVLIDRQGFLPENVTLLTDSAATRAGIFAAFAKLAQEAQPQDILYIHFSGHGSQVEDVSGDETTDGFDETILPHDARTEGIPDITDDEIGEFLASLRAETAVMVLDACHSGTATRSLIRTRSVPTDTRVDLYRRPEADAKKFATRAIVQLDKPERYVLLTGAASHQSALDGPIGGEYVGLFSYALSQAMATSAIDASPRDLHVSVQQTFRQLSEQFGGLALPDPQIEAAAPLLDAPLFGSTRGPLVAGNDGMTMTRPTTMPTAGMPSGNMSAPGSPASGTSGSSMSGGSPSGSGQSGSSSSGSGMRPNGSNSGGASVGASPAPSLARPNVRPPAIAALTMPPAESIGLVVGWAAIDDGLRTELESEILKLAPEARFAGEGEASRFLVEFAGGQCRVYDAGGVSVVLEFPLSTVDDAAQRLSTLFSRSSKASTLVTMTNPQSRVQVHAQVLGAGEAPLRIRQKGSGRNHQNSLMIELQTNVDSFVTIVDVDAEGGINVLFPNNYTKDGFLPQGFVRAGQTVRIPDAFETGNRAGFFWDYQPPVGLDTIQVFANTDLAGAEEFRAMFREAAAPATRGASPAGKSAPLQRLIHLREALRAQVATRGVGVVADVPAAPATTAGSSPNAMPGGMPNSASATQNPMQTTMNLPGSAAAVQFAADWNSTSIRIRIDP